jgi:DNA-binding NarL/FixJ family response regulator
MHFPYAIPEGEQDRMRKGTLVIIDNEPFSQECLVQAIHSALPYTPVTGISAPAELDHIDSIALVLMRLQAQSVSAIQMASQTRAIAQYCPNTPIVMLSMCMNAVTLSEAIALGVRGIIPVTTSFNVAIAALQLVLAGGTYYPYLDSEDLHSTLDARDPVEPILEPSEPLILPHVAARHYLTVVERSEGPSETDAGDAGVIFTAREMEVLEALQKGWSNKWIAHSLRISENTIKVHVQRIMRKLHATNRTEAVVRHRQLNGLE